jgi:FRG domain
MNPLRIEVTGLEALHQVFRGYRSHEGMGCLFRGQADLSWDLLPKAARPAYYLPDNRDLGRFNAWAMQAVAYLSLPSSILEQLALAQHHGLATRLLDWSMNPLVACYFACCELLDKDGAVYIYETPDQLLTEKAELDLIKSARGVYPFIPKSISQRVMNQRGVFTVHCDASQKINIATSRLPSGKSNLVELRIPAELKIDVIKLLEDYGIDRAGLFPDLDGLSISINAKTERMQKVR